MNLPPWSYTLLSGFENCPRQAFHRYIKKDLKFEESEASRWGNEVHKAMELAINEGRPLPKGMEYAALVSPLLGGDAERKFGIRRDGTPGDFFAPDVWGRCKIDCILIKGDAAILPDWKTGKVREDPDELEINAVLVKAHYPHLKKITGWYVWLKEKRIGRQYDLSNTEAKFQEIKARYSRFEQAFQTDFWPPRQSGLCAYCAVKSCEFNTRAIR